jgi:hypothetical protein
MKVTRRGDWLFVEGIVLGEPDADDIPNINLDVTTVALDDGYVKVVDVKFSKDQSEPTRH